jgi:uncharacterized protein YggE
MDTKPDTIKVTAFQREEIFASHANLYVTVKGSSVVSGDQALKKAREVSQLVEALTSYGLRPEAIQLLGVHIETESGILLKSSSASYRLRIRVEKLDQLAELLDIIASQKNATLERIEWKYPDEAARERALDSAMAKAKAKAGKIATAMGVRLLGVYDFSENVLDEEMPVPYHPQAAMMKSRAMTLSEPSLGMDIQHSKTVTVSVEIWYRVSSF